MVRKFGAKTESSRAGTGKINKEETNSEKWATATASQLGNKGSKILVKNLPISYIRADQDNPRKLKINAELIKEIYLKHPINNFIKNEEDNDWVEDYVEKVSKEFNLKGKQIGDFTSIVEFSAVLKSPKRLLHPVVVWQEDSIFHLISGERRLLTHILLGEEYISSRICEEKLTEREIDILQWEENVHREDMTLFEKAMRLKKLIEGTFGFSNISVRKLVKISGLNLADAQRYLAIIRYPTNTLIKAIEEGKIVGLQKCAALAQLSEEELTEKLSAKVVEKKITIKPAIKISKDADSEAIKKIITVVTKEFKAESILENLDLSKSKDLNIAFNSLVTFLKEG
jgi:ParB-like chromosome segregation protein Spo0J